jgi:uncharacterized protein YndB with AHSA1/START domain
MELNREVTREVVVDASLEDVWRLVTDEAELATWMADAVRLDPRPGGEVRFTEGEDVRVGRVTEVDEARRLQLVWWPEGGGPASEVTLTVERVAEGTRLVVAERVTGGVGLKGRSMASMWDDRLLGLELRCLVSASARVGLG